MSSLTQFLVQKLVSYTSQMLSNFIEHVMLQTKIKLHDGVMQVDSVWWDSTLDSGADFGWTDLKPGLYNVRIKLQGVAEPVRQWDGLVVEPGELNRDGRLQDIDLDGMVTSVPIEVVAVGGGAVPAASVQLVGGTDWTPWTKLPGGQGSISLVELPAEVRVQAEGYLTRTVAVDGRPLQVVVDLAPTIELILPPGLQLPEEAELQAQLTYRHGDDGSWRPSGADPAAFRDGRARTSVAGLGELRVTVLLERPIGFGSSTSWLTWPGQPPVFEITAGSDGAVFDLPVTQAMIDAGG